jgi:hypothetical protein
MSRPKPPKPANDHLAAFGGGGDDPDALTDEQLEARLDAAWLAQRRAYKLALLREREASLARMNAAAEQED